MTDEQAARTVACVAWPGSPERRVDPVRDDEDLRPLSSMRREKIRLMGTHCDHRIELPEMGCALNVYLKDRQRLMEAGDETVPPRPSELRDQCE
jgi:hypothetical protein